MQDYYAQNVFTAVPNATLQLSFAGTLWEFFIYLCSPIVQISISKFGYTSTNVFGLLLMTLGCELASFSTEIWHLYMTQGLLFGAGSCFLFITTTGLVPQWFTRRRGLANGVIAAGTGLGGLVLPLLVITPSNNTLGIAWTYRIIGILTFGFNVFTCIVVKPRRNDKLDEKQIKLQTRQQRMFDMEVFKDLNYILWVAASVIGILAFTLPYFFLPSYATHLGLNNTDASVVIGVLSASNFVGRVFVGYLGDHIGRLNAHILFTTLAGLSSLIIWTFAYTYGALIAFSVVFGITGASFYSLFAPITARITGLEKFPTGQTMLLFANTFGVFGPSIASAVADETFLAYKIFTGVVYIISSAILLLLKLNITRRKLFAKI